jgi:NAD(P)-dependent dehydrogenase (short-subunit alcohol dehydrogenase family)
MPDLKLGMDGRVVLITGAGSGIGRAAALAFSRQGFHVICTDKNEETSLETANLVTQEGGQALHHKMDVTSTPDILSCLEAVKNKYDRIDVLFNNAGETVKAGFRGTSDAMWNDMVASNLSGAFLCSKYFLPLLENSKVASVINHASIDAILGNAANAAYSAAKGGLIPLTHVMAHDLGPLGIRVNCICSGGIYESEKHRGTPGLQSRIDVTPLGRAGNPQEVANVALFLASDMSSFVNASVIVVDGGRSSITQGTYFGYENRPKD